MIDRVMESTEMEKIEELYGGRRHLRCSDQIFVIRHSYEKMNEKKKLIV